MKFPHSTTQAPPPATPRRRRLRPSPRRSRSGGTAQLFSGCDRVGRRVPEPAPARARARRWPRRPFLPRCPAARGRSGSPRPPAHGPRGTARERRPGVRRRDIRPARGRRVPRPARPRRSLLSPGARRARAGNDRGGEEHAWRARWDPGQAGAAASSRSSSTIASAPSACGRRRAEITCSGGASV